MTTTETKRMMGHEAAARVNWLDPELPTDVRLAHARASENPLADIVDALSAQLQHLSLLVAELQEREQMYLRRRVATPAQELAVIRQVTIPALLQRIREEGV